jgi:SLT domain-containing protein
VAVNDRHIGFIIGPGGAGFAARSTATGIGKQSFASGYTYRTWGGAAAGEGTCEGGTGPDGPPNGFPPGVKGFAAMVAQVCRMLGIPQATNAFLSQMKSESNGNPRAINNWDSNAKRGTPSKGLLQLIDPTFLAYAGPYKSRGIWDPFANIYAGVNYAKSRYGSRLLQVIGHGHGYAHGGIISEHVVGIGQQTGDIYHIGEAGYPEMVTPLNGSTAEPGPFTRDRGGGGGTVINVYPQAGQSEEQIAAAVGRRLAWAEAGGRT